MEGIKGLFESMKEFIWDIVGFFIPGIYVIIVLSVIVKPTYFLQTPLIGIKDSAVNFIIIIVAYVLGYVIFGFGEWFEQFWGSKSFREVTVAKIATNENYKLACEVLQTKITAAQATTPISSLSVKEVRNLTMSYVPDADKKVYTFMFRSDLARHIGNSSLLIFILTALLLIIQFFIPELAVLKVDASHIVLYIFLFICFFMLKYTRNRFYRIAMNLPFSIYISTVAK